MYIDIEKTFSKIIQLLNKKIIRDDDEIELIKYDFDIVNLSKSILRVLSAKNTHNGTITIPYKQFRELEILVNSE